LVPGSKSSLLALKLIDYDGMFVPPLAHYPSGEVGHANYQHPRRLREGCYDDGMDRFSHLLIYTALRCLHFGGEELWQRYDNQENLLFREDDFRRPSKSLLLRELWEMPDRDVRSLVGHLLLASLGPVGVVPMLDALVDDSGIRPLSDGEEARINDLLDDGTPQIRGSKAVGSINRFARNDKSTPRPNERSSTVSSPPKPQTAVLTAEPTVDAAAMTDTQPIRLKPASGTRQRRPISTEVDLDVKPLEPEVAGRSPFDAATLADPLVSMLSRPAWLATLGVIALVSFLVVNVLVWSSLKQPLAVAPRPALGTLEDVVLKAGHKKRIHFTVERHDYKQPMTLRIEGLPDEMEVPPLTLPTEENKASLTLLAPLDLDLPHLEPRVSLWDGHDKIDEKTFQIPIERIPRPVLRSPNNIACQVGRYSDFRFDVQRNDCREPLWLRLEGLPPQVRQECAPTEGVDTLTIKLTVAADSEPQPIPVRLLLCVGDVIADQKALLLNIRKNSKLKPPQVEQKPEVRLKDKTPQFLTVEPGKAGELPVLLDHRGSTREVKLQLDGLPAGAIAAPVTVAAGLSGATVTIETSAETPLGEHNARLRLRVHEQTLDERDITLSVRRTRGRQESVHFPTVDHMELAGTLYHGWKGKQGMTVLMLHDLGRHRSSSGWKRLAEALQAEGHTVLTFDFRGHGDSKKVSAKFWSHPVNKYLPLPAHEPGLPADKQPKTLDIADLPVGYLLWLIEDIAAARTYLDLRHDEPNCPVNSFNLVVLGAGRASALGSFWLATEGLRFNAADVNGKVVPKPREKLSVLQALWLGMEDPLKISPFLVQNWLRDAHAKPVVPILFVYGEDDNATSRLLDIPIREQYGTEFVIRGASQSGQRLLDKNANAAERIKQHLVKTLKDLPPQPWVPRRIKTLHSYWAFPMPRLPGGREQMRLVVAKRVGQETLAPLPFQPLGIPIVGLVEPSSFVTDKPEP
jgi:pimeloyl-ACP methyl ester carboxylesterase